MYSDAVSFSFFYLSYGHSQVFFQMTTQVKM